MTVSYKLLREKESEPLGLDCCISIIYSFPIFLTSLDSLQWLAGSTNIASS